MAEAITGGATNSCPDVRVWLDVVAGLAPGDEAERLVQHAASCNHCQAALADAARLFAGEPTPGETEMLERLQTSTPEWQQQTARELERSASRGRVMRMPVRWLAAAAAVIIVAGGGLVWWQQRNRPPFELLAEAYQKRRVVELRIPGALYAEMRANRGGAADRPAELSESEGKIQRRLKTLPSDPSWLLAQGRAQLLEFEPRNAIDTLKLASVLSSTLSPRLQAEILTDLATGHFEQAESAGDVLEYSQAAELLGEAIQLDRSFALAYFNRAIVGERLQDPLGAEKDWQNYLDRDSHGPWADVARDRLAKLKRQRSNLGNSGAADHLPEQRLNRAMSGSAGDERELADELHTSHGDTWLADILSPAAPTIAPLLRDAERSRLTFHVDSFPGELAKLRQLDGASLSPAWRALLEFEKLFRVTHSPRTTECGDPQDLAVECGRRGYVWLQAQVLMEQSTCQMARNQLASAELSTREAIEQARRHGYPVAELRADGFLVIQLANAGRYQEAAAVQNSALRLYWSQPLPVIRGQELYHDAVWMDAALGWNHAAKSAAESSASMAHEGGLAVNEAVNRARWAEFAERLGLDGEAREQYSRSEQIFDGLERNDASDESRAFAEAAAAEAGIETGRLARFESTVRASANPMVAVPYLRALASAELKRGDQDGATDHLRQAIQLLGGDRSEAPGEERWRSELQRNYRDLVLVRLQQDRTAEAYRLWQEFLAADEALQGFHPAENAVAASAHESPVVVTFARLRDSYAIWVRDAHGLRFRWAANAAGIDRNARCLAELCARPESPVTVLLSTAERLSKQLMAGWALDLPADAGLIIQTDSDLAAIPWQLLPTPSGMALGDHHLVAVTPLPVPYPGPVWMPVTAIHRELAVGGTVIPPSYTTEYPPLPGIHEELESVRDSVPGTDVLEGRAATVANLEAHLAGADALHFAGHAVHTARGLRLLVAPDAQGYEGVEPAALWLPGGAAKRLLALAVLSACATGRSGESESLDPESLAADLLMHGAKQVVAARWNVDSVAASRFMKVFYRSLRRNQSAAAALREAEIEIRAQPGWAHPYFWAAFALYVQV